MKNGFSRILQISDLHLFADINHKLMQLNTYKSFCAVLELVDITIQEIKPSLIILTGDLSQDGSAESYQHIVNRMQQYPCDIAWIPGNHDIPAIMKAFFEKSYLNCSKHFVLNKWQIILLDSHSDGKISGNLNEKQLTFLKNTLDTNKNYALIMLHHHVLPVKSTWVDQHILINGADFFQVIDQYDHIKSVICGHVHQDSEQVRLNVSFITTPSTCLQFKAHQDKFSLDTLMPGFRIIDLYDNGEIKTTVRRIAYDPDYLPDMNSNGY